MASQEGTRLVLNVIAIRKCRTRREIFVYFDSDHKGEAHRRCCSLEGKLPLSRETGS